MAMPHAGDVAGRGAESTTGRGGWPALCRVSLGSMEGGLYTNSLEPLKHVLAETITRLRELEQHLDKNRPLEQE